MKFIHPLLLQRMQELIPDPSEASFSLIKLILKIFYSYVQLDFPLSILTMEVTEQWIETIRRVLDTPVPPQVRNKFSFGLRARLMLLQRRTYMSDKKL